MNYLSVCSGIEAATVAWHQLGWKAAAFSEIEKFPAAVLKHHYPDVPNLGDMTNYSEWEIEKPIDLLVGGTPCQSFSVAGLRAGMADPRGNLALVFLAIADKLRARWVVWENVPGVLSSSGGRDFGAFLGALVQLGYGFAYRVLDAQFFGVPQRRRRVFVIGYFGDWRRAAAVLFERHSLSGDSPPRRKTGEGVAADVAGSLGGGSGARGWNNDLDRSGAYIPQCFGGNNTAGEIGVATACNASGSRRYDFESETFVTHSLRADGFDASEDGTGRGTPIVPVATLAVRGRGDGRNFEYRNDGTANALMQPNGGRDGIGVGAIASGMMVRRLTPRECERLQGFPDDYTLINFRGKQAADGPRYKALGNSMAVPVMRWIGMRIEDVEKSGANRNE